MCDPTSIAIAGLALSAASTVTGLISQQQAASAQADAQNAYNRQQEQNALIARNQNLAALETERNAALADTREQIQQNTLALQRAQATARVSAGEAGIAGLSVDALLRDLAGQAGYDNATATENYLRQDADINARREGVQTSTTNSITSIRNPVIQAPDYLGAALRFGQTGLNIYSDYRDRQNRLNNPQTS